MGSMIKADLQCRGVRTYVFSQIRLYQPLGLMQKLYFFVTEEILIMNYGFLTTEKNSSALYIFHGFHHLISKAIFKEYPSSY